MTYTLPDSTHLKALQPPSPTLSEDGLSRALNDFFLGYFRFSGRSSRGEYWWVMLTFASVAVAILGTISLSGWLGAKAGEPGAFTGFEVLMGLAMLVGIMVWVTTLLPLLTLTVRRLHDVNLSGWFVPLTMLVPVVGPVILLGLAALPSSPAGVRFDKKHA